MRTLVLLLLALPVAAEDTVEAALEELAKVRTRAFEVGGSLRLDPAITRVLEFRDVRAVAPLAELARDTFHALSTIRERLVALGVAEKAAAGRAAELEVMAKHLTIRVDAGANDMKPELDELRGEAVRLARVARESVDKAEEQRQVESYVVELRRRLGVACASLLKDADQVGPAIESVAKAFDFKASEQALLFVEIVRPCRRAETLAHLASIAEETAAGVPARRQAIAALAAVGGREAAKTLLGLWERDEATFGAHIKYALSMAARRQLADLDAARDWAATLK